MQRTTRLLFVWIAMSLIAALALAAPVTNADKVVKEVTASELRALLKDKKIDFEEAKDNEDKTMFVLTLEKYKVVLYQYGGEGDKGTSLALSGTWELEDEADIDDVNGWNLAKRFTKVYKDDEGNLHMEADLDIEAGVTIGAIAKWIESFEKQMPEFLETFSIE